MARGFARYLYVPEDGTRYPMDATARVEQALRDAGIAVGPDGEGTHWKPMRPAGALATWSERAGLVHPTIEVSWHDEPQEVCDTFLPARGPWSRCPECAKLIPTQGVIVAPDAHGEDAMTILSECPSCGAGFEPNAWERCDDKVVFRSRFIVGVLADSFQRARPTFGEGCPEFVSCVEEVLGTKELGEVFVAW